MIYFSGVVREIEGNAPITAIDYEAHEEMARHQFALIFDAVEKSWPVESVRLVHRLGVVPVNEPSLWVEVTAPHRAEAFDACQFLIDEMKNWQASNASARCGGGIRRLPIPHRRDEAKSPDLEKAPAGLAQYLACPGEGLFAGG